MLKRPAPRHYNGQWLPTFAAATAPLSAIRMSTDYVAAFLTPFLLEDLGDRSDDGTGDPD